jgi:hypothetical protein
MEGLTIIERAFELAPECGSMEELKRRLIREGYFQVNAHLSGWQIRRDIVRRLNHGLLHHVPKRLREPEK